MSEDWEKLTPYKQSRLRTEMYFGSRDPMTQVVLEYGDKGAVPVETTWVPAIFTAFRELLDNALDEVVTHAAASRGSHVDVTYDPKWMVFSVSDDGRGIPFNWSDKHGNYAATVLLSEPFSGRNYVENRGASRGLNGVGAKTVNYCSEWFEVSITRGGNTFDQRFEEGDELRILDPVIAPAVTKRKTGTKITAKLSSKVFREFLLPESFMMARMFETALCYPQVHLTYNGKRVIAKDVEKALFPSHVPVTVTVNKGDFNSRFWLVPEFMDKAELSHSLVNGIPAFNGGNHVDAFKRYFFSGLLTALERENKRRKLVPNRSDIADGLLIFNITQMDAPSFDSQNKTRLIDERVATIVKAELDNPEFFKSLIAKNKDWIEAIYARCAARSSKRDAADLSRDAKKNLRSKVEDLEDACSVNRSKCVLFLAEGKSAISGIVDARNAEIHGGLPLRGKTMNVREKTAKEAMESEVLRKIMNAIGLVPGQRVNRHALRYGAVYLTTDADEDGKNITALLVNFFYTFWPDLFDPKQPPFIYAFDTPLIIAAKGKQRKYWYSDSYHQFKSDAYKGWEITRAKGLAALKKVDWEHVLAHPKLVPIVDDGRLGAALDLLFGKKNADARKEWIGL